MSKRIIVTAGLPYANGNLHIGHLVEYCQADMYVRALKGLGENALYICAADTHGTPIELNAAKQGVEPIELATRYNELQQKDFAKFGVEFDQYSISHSESNRELVNEVYQKLKDGGHIFTREVEGMWDEKAQRFLPDRFIKGTCPICGTPEQYGDVCEHCKSTYSPKDLKDPRSVLTGTVPVVKTTEHVFFRLSAEEHVSFLREWTKSGTLPDDQKNYVADWIDKGLMDWDISRDGPYFGFEIPDQDNQFFYVWFDAPLCYAATSREWGDANGVPFDQLWMNEDETVIEHIIGKDIVYFHTLFWPAMLRAAGMTLPRKVHVHGMLTVDGVKMSKSRGTFINASVFAEHIEPEALRFYLASKYGAGSEDLDLSLDDFVTRVNAELVNKHANLFSRAAQFLNRNLEGTLSDLPFTAAEAQDSGETDNELLRLAREVVTRARKVESLYRGREFALAMRELGAIADIGNEYMQGQKPWDQVKTDPEAARLTLSFALNVCHALAIYLRPIVPKFAAAGARILNVDASRLDASELFTLRSRKIGDMERLFDRIDKKAVNKIVEASKDGLAPAETPKKKATATPGVITIQDFTKVELKVGLVESVETVPKSDKLLKLMVNLGEAEPRQIVSGIAPHYGAADLVGKRVIVVSNLAPAKLRGVESQGMILAAGEGDLLEVVFLQRELPPGTVVR